MAFSINNALSICNSSDPVNCLDGKKSLFFLKKIMILTKLGYKVLDDNVLNNTAGNLIDICLAFPDQDSDCIKKELQGLKLVQPVLAKHSLKEIFHAALSEITGISSLSKSQEVHFNQIYTEQFLTWMQEETEPLPASCFLLLLNIYHSFNDPSIDLDSSTWQDLFSLKGWSASQKKTLNQFKSKYESLNFCTLKSSFIKIENTIHLVEAIGNIKKVEGLYMLWSNFVEIVVQHLDEEQKKYFNKSLCKNKKFIKEKGEISNKEFITHARKMTTGFLYKFEQAKEKYKKKFLGISIRLSCIQKCLKNEENKKQIEKMLTQKNFQKMVEEIEEDIQRMQKDKNEWEDCLQQIQDVKRITNRSNIMGEERPKDIVLTGTEDQSLKKIDLLKLFEESEDELYNTLRLKGKSLSSILFLTQWLVKLLEKEGQLINQLEQEKCIVYKTAIEKSKKSFKKHSTSLKKKNLTKSGSFIEDLSITSKNTSKKKSEEEPSINSFSESSDTSDTSLENIDSFSEMNMYITRIKEGKNTQINGLLSQAVNDPLKTLKTHLLRTRVADELKELYDLQAKEVYDHLLLGAAGLDLIIQAIHDQRTDHVVLGFRAALLHCYYAMEQKLSQEIILETHKILDEADQVHNLLYLAQKANIVDIKKWEQFLQEMTLHLAFSYPEDYRLFFRQRNELEAFSLLEDLSDPSLDNKKIEEALEFCFEMYDKSIAFITEVSSAHIKEQSELSHVMRNLKEQIIKTLHETSTKKILFNQASVIQPKESDPVLVKVQQMLRVLHPFLKDFNLVSSCEEDQKIYAAIGTVQSYLKLMQISLEIPQSSTQHSLQKFIRLETITNVDNLFRHLFRAVILLESGEDSHLHTLTKLFPMVAHFYQRDDKHAIDSHLKKITLGISHHYLHITWNRSELRTMYNKSLTQAYALLHVSGEYTVTSKKIKKSDQGLQENISKINDLVSFSLDLFMELLEPTLEEIKKRYPITAVA